MQYSKSEMAAWHTEVCQRDNYICQACHTDFSYECNFNEKGVNQMVCGDHIITKGSDISKVLDPNNGRCVCFQCHELITRGMELEEAGKLTRTRKVRQIEKSMPKPQKTAKKKKKLEKFWGQSKKPWQGSKKPKGKKAPKQRVKIIKVYNRHTGKLETIK